MMATVQSVIISSASVTKKIVQKISLRVFLLISTSARKNYASIARSNDVPYKDVYLSLEDAAEYCDTLQKTLIRLIKDRVKDGAKGKLIIDFTLINKPHSYKTKGITYDYDSSQKYAQKGISTGVAIWADAKVAIPFDMEVWLRRQDVPEGQYRTKIEIAKKLILRAMPLISFTEVMLDGAFASVEMLTFLNELQINYVIRIPRNRVVTSGDGEFQLKEHPELKLNRNQKYKTMKASFKGIPCFITAHKRNGKNGTREIVYLVSSVERSAKEHVLAYKERWCVEKFFRTAKQHLGLADCQSTSFEKQKTHIFLVMLSYSMLSQEAYYKKKKSIEEILRLIRSQKSVNESPNLFGFKETFMS